MKHGLVGWATVAIGLALGAFGCLPVTAAADPPPGIASFSADPSSITIPGGANLTATTDHSIAGTGYSISIVNDDTSQTIKSCNQFQAIQGVTCIASVGTNWSDNANPQPMHFHAEVTPGGGSSSQLTIPVQAFRFTATLQADSPSIGIPQSTNLTATVNQSIVNTPYSILIVDDDTGQTIRTCNQLQAIQGTKCIGAASSDWSMQLHPTPMHFHAEVRSSTDEASNEPATTVDVRRASFNIGLSFTGPSGSGGNVTWNGTATSSPSEVGTPFTLYIRNTSTGASVASCWNYPNCYATVGPGTYQAKLEDSSHNVIAKSDPWTLTDTSAQDQMLDGVDLVALAAMYDGPVDVCTMLELEPEIGTHVAESSLSDQALACESASEAGSGTVDTIRAAAAAAGGAAAGPVLWALLHSALDGYAIPDDGTGTGAEVVPPSGVADPTWPVAATSAALLARNVDLTQAAADHIAAACLWATSGADLRSDDVCDHDPIFSSGSDYPEATDHDIDAVAKHPFVWTRLNYIPSGDKGSHTWYTGDPACANPAEGQSCDEYPFFATAQGGGDAVPTPSLRLIDAEQNSAQGGRYGNFVQSCGLSSGDPFLGIPLPPELGVPTLWVCRG